MTYADSPCRTPRITAGEWWPEDYDGPPQISFAAEEAEEIGLELGDELTVNILGRDITGTITRFREVDFSTAGIGFVLAMNPAALEGAPHTFISTVYAEPEAEAQILRDLAGDLSQHHRDPRARRHRPRVRGARRHRRRDLLRRCGNAAHRVPRADRRGRRGRRRAHLRGGGAQDAGRHAARILPASRCARRLLGACAGLVALAAGIARRLGGQPLS